MPALETLNAGIETVCEGCKIRVFNPTTFGALWKPDPEAEYRFSQEIYLDIYTADLVSPLSSDCSFCFTIRQIMQEEISLDRRPKALWDDGINMCLEFFFGGNDTKALERLSLLGHGYILYTTSGRSHRVSRLFQ